MTGQLGPDLTPCVKVEIKSAVEDCVVDTGFGGALYLSETKIAELNLPFLTTAPIALADKSEVIADVFEVTVKWLSVDRRVAVIAGPHACETLIGMELLTGCRIELDELAGQVRIERL